MEELHGIKSGTSLESAFRSFAHDGSLLPCVRCSSSSSEPTSGGFHRSLALTADFIRRVRSMHMRRSNGMVLLRVPGSQYDVSLGVILGTREDSILFHNDC